MGILYVGIDLAKNVFAVHGVDEHGKAVLGRPSVARAKLHDLIASLPPCRASSLPPSPRPSTDSPGCFASTRQCCLVEQRSGLAIAVLRYPTILIHIARLIFARNQAEEWAHVGGTRLDDCSRRVVELGALLRGANMERDLADANCSIRSAAPTKRNLCPAIAAQWPGAGQYGLADTAEPIGQPSHGSPLARASIVRSGSLPAAHRRYGPPTRWRYRRRQGLSSAIASSAVMMSSVMAVPKTGTQLPSFSCISAASGPPKIAPTPWAM
jgi:hypothetical protein